MSKKIKQLFLLLTIAIFLTGCAEQRILEDLGIITAYGLDLNENGTGLNGAISTYQFNTQLTSSNELIYSTGNTARDVYKNADATTAKQLVTGQLRATLFGSELAKNGIIPHLDGLRRNPLVAESVYIATTSTQASEVINATNFEESPNVGVYIYRLLEHAVNNENIIDSDFHEFLKNYMKVGADPLTPLLSKVNEKVAISGLGLYQDDRLVGTVGLKETFYIRLLIDEFNSGETQFALPSEKYSSYLKNDTQSMDKEQFYVGLHQISNSTTISLNESTDYGFDIDVDLEGRITELTENLELSQPEVLRMLEEDITDRLKENIEKILTKTQEFNADVIGFGTHYNKHFKDSEKLSEAEWREKYPDFQFNVKANVKILRYGITE